MRAVFLTSSINAYTKDENGVRIPRKFGQENNFLTNLKKYIKGYSTLVYVASDADNYISTDEHFLPLKEAFDLTLPFQNYIVLDGRNKDKAPEILKSADVIYLCGGHVPTQNKFFENIRLREIIATTTAVVIGESAGSMNCAGTVYSPPELEGEGADKDFCRYYKGLNLTDINIFPHYNETRYELVDGLEFEKDLIIPDSYKHKIIAYSDGAYILIYNNVSTLYGEGYAFENGIRSKLSSDNETAIL